MRILALIFSAISFCGLLMLVNVEIYHFMPASAGPEGGMIDAALGLICGGSASLGGLLFAFLYFRRAQTRFSRLLLQWCSVVLLGFILVVIHMILDYRHAQAAYPRLQSPRLAATVVDGNVNEPVSGCLQNCTFSGPFLHRFSVLAWCSFS